jgi:hypothetical protein
VFDIRKKKNVITPRLSPPDWFLKKKKGKGKKKKPSLGEIAT